MPIYAATIFVSAFLLFQIEPMIAKYLLPWFGGTAMVWTTCLLFFQTLLLAGYTYAHLIGTKLAPRRQVFIHLGLIALCVLAIAMPAMVSHSTILPGSSWKPMHVEFPLLRILVVLGVSIGLPYFVLSATAPLLQSWFAKIYPASSAYRLYALSNFGSLLALLTYPFVVEPNFALRTQANLWSIVYVAFAIGMLLCAWPLRSQAVLVREEVEAEEETTIGTMALWIGVSACAAVLLYGATTQMSQDIAPIPFLWVLPLGLYLLSFIICFDSDRWYRRGIFQPLFAVAVFASFFLGIYSTTVAAGISKVMLTRMKAGLVVEVANASLLMFTGCMVCNGELVRLKPHRRDLTMFYLLVSAGGVLGGIFAVIVAPLIFRGLWEFRLAVWATLVLMIVTLMRDRSSWIHRDSLWPGLAILVAALAFPLLLRVVEYEKTYTLVAILLIGALARMSRWRERPAWLRQPGSAIQLSMMAAAGVLGITYIVTIGYALHDARLFARNFYGVFRIVSDDHPQQHWHSFRLLNGRITHGMQVFSSDDPQMRYFPTSYYSPDSGIGLLMMNHPKHNEGDGASMRVGVVGLGVGTISAWGRPGDYFRFYEINPAIIHVASDPNGFFTYLRDSSAKVDIVPGDARLSMEQELAQGRSQQFDVLAIDAFNGDSIPTHLLTREAMMLYLSELAPDGVLAIHVSNLFLDLKPVLAEHSRAFNLKYGYVDAEEKNAVSWASDWVLLARDDRVLGLPAIASHLQPRDGVRRVRPWTDDYSNLFQLLK